MNKIRYSQAGYVAALRMRSRRTLLVEGVTDRKVVAALLSRHQANAILDTADLIEPEHAGQGNRELAERTHSAATNSGTILWCLVDREYRDFEFSPPADLSPVHAEFAKGLYWTRGHSVECYLLRREYVSRVLRMYWAEILPHECIGAVDVHFGEILSAAAGLSLAAASASCLKRMTGLLTPEMWSVDSPIGLKEPAFTAALVTRGVPRSTAGDILSTANELSALLRDEDELSRWACHGHLGWESVWTSVAEFARSFGVDSKCIDEIAHGHQEYKLRALADAWADAAATKGDCYPERLVDSISR